MRQHTSRYLLALLLALAFTSIQLCARTETLRHTAYTSFYDSDAGQPLMVCWTLTPDMITKEGVSRSDYEFTTDPLLLSSSRYPQTSDYTRNGLSMDRGHLMPAADCKYDAKAMEESFYIGANVCPQQHELNEGAWCDLEKQCRFWSRYYYKTDLQIWSGPIYDSNSKRIGEYGIKIPSHLWKVIARTDTRTGQKHVIAFFFPNDSSVTDYTGAVVSLSSLKARLPAEIAGLLPSEGIETGWKL